MKAKRKQKNQSSNGNVWGINTKMASYGYRPPKGNRMTGQGKSVNIEENSLKTGKDHRLVQSIRRGRKVGCGSDHQTIGRRMTSRADHR